MIKIIGFWKDYTTLQSDGVLEDEECTIYDEVEKEKILSYLKSGTMIMASPGLLNCLKCNSKGIAGSFSIITDGEWVWPEYYIHYIDIHNIQINPAFITKMKNNGFLNKSLSKKKSFGIMDKLKKELENKT